MPSIRQVERGDFWKNLVSLVQSIGSLSGYAVTNIHLKILPLPTI